MSTHPLDDSFTTEKESKVSSSSSTEDPALGKNDTKAVSRLRRVVIAVLIASTTAVAIGVYYYFRRSEIRHFHDAFTTDANSIIAAIVTGVSRTLESVDALAVNIASYADGGNLTFPFVTLPHYPVQGLKAMKQAPNLYCQVIYHVTNENREEWESYSYNNSGWLEEAYEVQLRDDTYLGKNPEILVTPVPISSSFGPQPPSEKGFMVAWQVVPSTSDYLPYNWDHYSALDTRGIDTMVETRQTLLRETWQLPDPANEKEVEEAKLWAETWYGNFIGPDQDPFEPLSGIYYPLLTSSSSQARADRSDPDDLVGAITTVFYWATTIKNILLQGKNGITVVFDNPCNPTFTYEINGPDITYLGRGDHHDPTYDEMMVSSSLLLSQSFETFNKTYTGIPLNEDFCPYTFRVYPTQKAEEQYLTNTPLIVTAIAALLFAASSGVFLIYDWLVERRQKRILNSATRSTALVSTLFPPLVRDQLLNEAAALNETTRLEAPNRKRLRSFLSGDALEEDLSNDDVKLTMYKRKPIAELFPETTVMFGDIAGFTAWSSTREPAQVFMLLETIYRSFDEAASRKKVFKVETVGDCYVAVAGVPDHRKDHAVVMARFARECVVSLKRLVKSLEVMLGPDTADLTMRFGLHSGPVTAGVLRGERSRFQLFGDTMNVAARMESAGKENRVHMSETTAKLLATAGKEGWYKKRMEPVEIKGKGVMPTYWLHIHAPMTVNMTSDESLTSSSSSSDFDGKNSRLIGWLVEVLSGILKQIQAQRLANATSSKKSRKGNTAMDETFDLPDVSRVKNKTVLDEVQEIVHLPDFDGIASQNVQNTNIYLGKAVEEQLKEYVAAIANIYNENPFHNFAHASHVTMSVIKLMSRIIAPDLSKETCTVGEIASKLHDHTYGITSDPLTQFACAFSALIHDVDHPGVPNTRLIVENPEMAKLYRDRSVAEQNSVDLAWNILMKPNYADLRRAIYGTNPETQKRFRQLVVNSVMATDIMDKDLKELRNKRWEKAFHPEDLGEEAEPLKNLVDRKATIVIEHLIQASDVAHTMQHWHVYRKWNEKLFREMYKAYTDGRGSKDPAEFWYKGEIGFFDFYVLPLAKKLKECGVFGVSSAEYLNYAEQNREEWRLRGEEMVQEMVQSLKNERETPRSTANLFV